jgi:hypothetical protein
MSIKGFASSCAVEELAPPDCFCIEEPWTRGCDELFG